jgi:integrase
MSGRGSIRRRGKTSWEVKFDDGRDSATGRRQTKYVTVKGKRQDAERELTRLIAARNNGTSIDPDNITVGEWLAQWLADPVGLAPRSILRYQQYLNCQVQPHIGAVRLQHLRPAHLIKWYADLRAVGLAPATISAARSFLFHGVERALAAEVVSRNVVRAAKPPPAPREPITVPKADQIAALQAALAGHWLEPLATLALQTGARRNEILALRWSDLNLVAGIMSITRSMERTPGVLRFKAPKTRSSFRTLSLSADAVAMLKAHRIRQLEERLAHGLGRPGDDALIFTRPDGSPMMDNELSRQWKIFLEAHGLPPIRFHSLRHLHASALLGANIPVTMIAKRLGHASARTTLGVYGHMLESDDRAAAQAIEAFLKR